MCGIVGVFGHIGPKQMNIFCTMLNIDITRGKDSTGVAVILRDGSCQIVKEVLFPNLLMQTKDWKKKVTDNADDIIGLIGHNRAATKGVVNKENAHPYSYNGIVMVHNGTLRQDFDIPKNLKATTDSMGMCKYLGINGIKKTWEEINGAAAIVYWDRKEQTLNTIRNHERPMNYNHSEDEKTLFFASEPWMIGQTCRMLGQKLAEVTKEATVWETAVHNLFTFSIDEDGTVAEDCKKINPFPQRPPTKKHTNPPHYQAGGRGVSASGNNRGNGNLFKDEDDRKPVEPLAYTEPQSVNWTSMDEFFWVDSLGDDANVKRYIDFDKFISKEDFARQYTECAFCSDPITADDYEEAFVIDDRHCVHKTCACDADAMGISIDQISQMV